jgi:4'-phosphopantetheinyl transferase
MLKVYSAKIEKIRQQLFPTLQPKKILQTLTGELIVRQILSDQLGYDPQTITILWDSYGKPYCSTPKSCHFNISHSGEWVVCAFDNKPIGIDIQKIVLIPRTRRDMIVLRFFDKCEQIQYFNLNEEEKENFFFTQWAIKESYIKLLEKGLRTPLQSFSAFLDQNGRGSMSDGDHIWYFQQYNLHFGHMRSK